MLKFRVLKARLDDASGIASVHVRTWQYAYKEQMPASILDNISLVKKTKSWKESLDKSKEGVYPFVAVADNKVIGWCTVGIKRDDNDLNVDVGEPYAIYVDPDFMSEGVA